ncbi:MAG TPA: lipoyl(octanoyl) transferase LipB [Candidatus Omnitrophota bacterium]|nr:lipoyl(octanoyl) transferase LipB [Candidatus Omnitrophota bacterium]
MVLQRIEKIEKTGYQYHDLGLIEYDQAYVYQQECVANVLQGGEEQVILCEHHPVITLGRLSDKRNILGNQEDMKRLGVIMRPVDRGGDVTLHAPGQLVAYPILNLNRRGRDLHKYLHHLEEVAIALLSEFGILGRRHPTQTGVWVKEKKIASLGIGVRKWVAYHGLAVNVHTDLKLFSLIKPCGLNVSMTSMAQEMKVPVEMAAVKKALKECLKRILG